MVQQNGIDLGNVMEVIEQPHQLMLTILYQGQEAYIPLHEESLKGVDHVKKRLLFYFPMDYWIYTLPFRGHYN